MSTSSFDLLSDFIYAGFGASAHEVRDKVFLPKVEGAMTFIDAEELGADEFKSFAEAVGVAYQTAGLRPDFHHYQRFWDMLLGLVDADPRCQSKN